MVKDLGPVTSKDVERLAHEPFDVLADMPLTGEGLRYLDVGFHNFVPQSFQYRLAILEDADVQHGIGAGQSIQLGAQNVKGSESTWKQRLDNYASWRQIVAGGIPAGQAMSLPSITLPDVTVEQLTEGLRFPAAGAKGVAGDAAQKISDAIRE